MPINRLIRLHLLHFKKTYLQNTSSTMFTRSRSAAQSAGEGSKAKGKRPIHYATPLQPSNRFIHREIEPECRFDISHDTAPPKAWTISFLTRIGFSNLANPPATHFYPRLVRLFYQNLSNGDTLVTTIDGMQISISEEDIALAYGIDASQPVDSVFDPPETFSINIMAEELWRRGTMKPSAIRHSSMPKDVWFLDLILFHNVVGIGHKSERTQILLNALYSARRNIWFSPAKIILGSMATIAKRCKKNTTRGNIHKLFFPYLITRLLLNAGFDIHPNEEASNELGVADWELSASSTVNTLRKKRAFVLRQQNVDDDEPREGMEDEDLDFIPSSSEEGGPAYATSEDVHRIENKIDDLTDFLHASVSIKSEEEKRAIYADYNNRRHARRQRD